MTDEQPQLELAVGETLEGKYRIERLLGVGGMGAVYLATRTTLGDRVAIKSILSSQNTHKNRARFIREARAMAAIKHPNVVVVFDYGEPAGRPPYMVMEYLQGPTLASVVEASAPLPPERALTVFAGICAAVEAGHRRGVVHRDLKPGNVILARSDDGRETVKVLDFGLARFVANEVSALTTPGAMVGTCSYMAPELIETGQASVQSDVWALGVILYQMVTGKAPFRGATNAATIMRIVGAQYEPPAAIVPSLPPPLLAGIEAALALDPHERPSSPEQLAALVGAPLGASASDTSGELPPLVEPSVVGLRPQELEPSVVGGLGAAPSPEVTMADSGVNPHGGEKTLTEEVSSTPREAAGTFVGRTSELDALRHEFRLALDDRGRIVVVSGDAGVGKTAVLDVFADWARGQEAVVSRGRFFAYEGDRPPPYETFLWMLSQPRSSAPDHALGRANRPGVEGDDPGFDKWQAFASMAKAFAEQARGRPLVVGLDDLQWASALDLEFIAYLPRTTDLTVLVVGTARVGTHSEEGPELRRWLSRLGAQRTLATVEVPRFGTKEVRAWFRAMYPGIRIRPQDLRRLQHATAGNPFYLSEVVRGLVDDGRIARDEAGWACRPLDDVVLPETVTSVVRAKLEGLDDELRTVLETACVLGEEFRFETLQAAVGIDEEPLEALLEEAVRRRLLSEEGLTPGSDFRFDTSTVRSVLYGQLGKRRRKRLHRAVVKAMGELYGETDGERIAKVLAYHYAAIDDHAETLAWGLTAAEESTRRNDIDHAELAVERARAAARALAAEGHAIADEDRARLDHVSGVVYSRIGRLDEAAALLEGALQRLASDPSRRLDTLLDLAECQLGRGRFDEGRKTGLAALQAAGELGDLRRELAARVSAGRCAAPMGNHAEAEALLTPVVQADDDPTLAAVRALAFAEQGWVHAKRGDFASAVASARRGLDLARSCGDALAEYRAVSVLGLSYLEGGDIEAAIAQLEQALDLARSLALRRREGVELHNLGECHYFEGDQDEALARGREALAIFKEIRDRATEGDVSVNIGRMLLARGDETAGRQMLEHGLELAAGAGRSEYEGLALVELADLDADEGAIERARQRLQRAHAIFDRMDSLYLWRAEVGLAKLARREGDTARALEHTRRAIDLLERLRARLGQSMNARNLSQSIESLRRLEISLSD